jgi:roadblock/LC7 domain-containing protein
VDVNNVELVFEKPSMCPANACMEVARTADMGAVVRNSQNPAVTIAYNADEWSAFIRGVRDGQFD